MVAMTPEIDGKKYLTVAQAVQEMGCSEAWVRTLIGRNGFPGAKRLGLRLWLIPAREVTKARDQLTTRAKGKRHLAARPLAAREKKPTRRG